MRKFTSKDLEVTSKSKHQVTSKELGDKSVSGSQASMSDLLFSGLDARAWHEFQSMDLPVLHQDASKNFSMNVSSLPTSTASTTLTTASIVTTEAITTSAVAKTAEVFATVASTG